MSSNFLFYLLFLSETDTLCLSVLKNGNKNSNAFLKLRLTAYKWMLLLSKWQQPLSIPKRSLLFDVFTATTSILKGCVFEIVTKNYKSLTGMSNLSIRPLPFPPPLPFCFYSSIFPYFENFPVGMCWVTV
jgi:hypothetical protein